MDDTDSSELRKLFTAPNSGLAPEVMGELESILRLYGIDAQELFYKWESYSMKMSVDNLNLKTAREFKKDIQEALERDSRGKAYHMRNAPTEKRLVGATPKAARGDVFGMLDSIIPNTPKTGLSHGTSSTIKRKSKFETPTSKATKSKNRSSPDVHRNGGPHEGDIATAFSERRNAGEITETLNGHIEITDLPYEPFPESRIKVKLNTEVTKFAYKTMAMKQSEASEILDDRIDEFMGLVQTQYGFEDSAFGNPTCQSTNEIIAVGRISSDTNEGKPNAASLILETSRRGGSGLRIPLRVETLEKYDFFLGMIVALRGTNASGEFFAVTEVLKTPLLPLPASSAAELREHRQRVNPQIDEHDNNEASEITSFARPLNILIGSGPYTSDTDLSFEPLQALLDKAIETSADALFLIGPFLDIEHPLVSSGSFPPFPPSANIDPDTADLPAVFRALISHPLHLLTRQNPSITIFIIPSTRDAVAHHVSWPQRKLPKNLLGLPKQALVLTNPVTVSLNETVIGVTSADVLDEIRRSECVGGAARQQNVFARLPELVIQQRHFFPVYPPSDRTVMPSLGAAADGRNAMTGSKIGGAKKGGHQGQDQDTTMSLNGAHTATDRDAEADPDADPDTDMQRYSMGATLDVSYLKLGDWLNVRPDILILPSVLTPFTKVIESVVTINPGTVSKRRGPGTYARMTVLPPSIPKPSGNDDQMDTSVAGKMFGHRLYERARVDIVRV